MVVREIFTRMGFQIDGGSLKKLDKNARHVRRQMGRLRYQARGLSTALKVGIGALVARLGVRFAFTDFTNQADRAIKSAQALGMSAENFQKLGYAAKLSGVEIGKIESSLGRLSASIADQTSRGARLFAELGIATKTTEGELRDSSLVLMDLADKFQAMPDGVEKTNLAMELFGRGAGLKMIPLLNQGSKAIGEMGSELASLGGVISTQAAKEAEDLNDNLFRLRTTIGGIRNQVMARFLPAINRLFGRMLAWAKHGDNLQRTIETISRWLRRLLLGVGLLLSAKMYSNIFKAIRLFVTLTTVIRKMGMAAALAKAKLMLIPLALLLLIALVEDLWGFTQGKDSLFGRMLDKAGIDPEPIRAQLVRMFEIFQTMGKQISNAWASIWNAMGVETDQAFFYLAAGIAAFIEGIAGTIQILAYMFQGLGEAIGKSLGWLVVNSIKLWDSMVYYTKAGVNATIEAFKALGSGIYAIFQWIGDFFTGLFDKAIESLKEAVRALPSFAQSAMPASVLSWAYEGVDVSDTVRGIASGLQGGDEWIAAIDAIRGSSSDGDATMVASSPVGERRTENTVNLGEINVSVEGTTNMDSPALKNAVGEGSRQAIMEIFDQLAFDEVG